jgi:hypothetical protein
MTGRRAIFGLCMLCALAFSAIAAQGASAKGQTAFTCTSEATVKDFAKEHCVPGETGTSFGHKEIPVNEVTHATLSNEKTNAETNGRTNTVLKETIAATNLELESTGLVDGVGTLKNEVVGTEMRASAESNASGITYNGVIVKAPAGKGCKVFEDNGGVKGAEGVVKTRKVKGHTTVVTDKENGEGTAEERHSVIIEPAVAGEPFASFFIECEKGKGVPEELEGRWEITGTITCPTHGATISCNHTTLTEQNTLKGKGKKAGLQGKATIIAGKEPITEPTHPISVTTEP